MRIAHLLLAVVAATVVSLTAAAPAYAAEELSVTQKGTSAYVGHSTVTLELENQTSKLMKIVEYRAEGREPDETVLLPKGVDPPKEVDIEVPCNATVKINFKYWFDGGGTGTRTFTAKGGDCLHDDMATSAPAPKKPGGKAAPSPTASKLPTTGLMDPGSPLEFAALWGPTLILLGALLITLSFVRFTRRRRA